MNKRKSCRITALILAAVAIIILAVGLYGLTRPISYGASYYHATFYSGEDFNGTMIFYPDNTLVISNTNFDEEFACYYYYKDGYAFFIFGETEAEYAAEVAAINEDFAGAVNTPFYASKINAFSHVSEGLDDYKSVYICQISVMMAVLWGAVELVLICFTFGAVVRCKKAKCSAQ